MLKEPLDMLVQKRVVFTREFGRELPNKKGKEEQSISKLE
jgi:hypothetical protein